jgi:hypothetical protein
MSPKEAAALLNIELQGDLTDQIEHIVFELKQKIYRQLDQLLLYPKWFKEIERIERASHSLGITWPENPKNQDLNPITQAQKLDFHLPMLDFFNQYQAQRKEMALQFHRSVATTDLKLILTNWLELQKKYLSYWSQGMIPTEEISLTLQLDPQAIFLILQELKEKDVLYMEDLKNTNIPEQLRLFMAWAQKIWSSVQAH